MGQATRPTKGVDEGGLRVRHRERLDGRHDAVHRPWHPRCQILPRLSVGAVLQRQRHVGDHLRYAARVSHRVLHLRPGVLQPRHHVGLSVPRYEVIISGKSARDVFAGKCNVHANHCTTVSLVPW